MTHLICKRVEVEQRNGTMNDRRDSLGFGMHLHNSSIDALLVVLFLVVYLATLSILSLPRCLFYPYRAVSFMLTALSLFYYLTLCLFFLTMLSTFFLAFASCFLALHLWMTAWRRSSVKNHQCRLFHAGAPSTF